MAKLIESYSKEKLVVLVNEFGNYIIRHSPDLREQFEVYVAGKAGIWL